jgi:hypothetical protein
MAANAANKAPVVKVQARQACSVAEASPCQTACQEWLAEISNAANNRTPKAIAKEDRASVAKRCD